MILNLFENIDTNIVSNGLQSLEAFFIFNLTKVEYFIWN